MHLDFLYERFERQKQKPAIIWQEREYSYSWLLDEWKKASLFLEQHNIEQGHIVALRADFNPHSVAFFLALIERKAIVVPISFAVQKVESFYSIAEVEHVLELKHNVPHLIHRNEKVTHQLLLSLRNVLYHPGLILFSSGSTGDSKAVVHDFVPLLDKFKVKKRTLRTMTFLLFDHIGGVNTLLYILSNTGTVVTLHERSPDNVCRSIEKFKVELLPTSPTFINMLLMSRIYERYDLSSLRLITYGTEAMAQHILDRFHKLFPHIELKQTYGLSELGILRSKSKDSNSVWVKVGGEDYQTKVIDGILYVKAKTAMLGYLNAASPFTEDGWFNTQDQVLVDGEWLKFLGRETDIINVGGRKVYPAEVESVLLEIENIQDAVVFAKPNPIIGQVVAARVNLEHDEPLSSLKKRIRRYCKGVLEEFKIPAFLEISEEPQISERFKKVRT